MLRWYLGFLKRGTEHWNSVIGPPKQNESFASREYMRGEYDNLRSKIQASETRITKELRDKAEKQAREASTMDET